MSILVWLHLIGAGIWLGGLVGVTMAVVVGSRTLPREFFQRFVRTLGWAFAGLSVLAWLLIAIPGLLMAAALRWPELSVAKTAFGAGILLASGLHLATARLTASRVAVIASRALALGIFLSTLVVFWLGVQLAT